MGLKKYSYIVDEPATDGSSSLKQCYLILQEIKQAVADGAKEIDIVINRTLALQHKWDELYQ